MATSWIFFINMQWKTQSVFESPTGSTAAVLMWLKGTRADDQAISSLS